MQKFHGFLVICSFVHKLWFVRVYKFTNKYTSLPQPILSKTGFLHFGNISHTSNARTPPPNYRNNAVFGSFGTRRKCPTMVAMDFRHLIQLDDGKFDKMP